jgi:hypothetical protein
MISKICRCVGISNFESIISMRGMIVLPDSSLSFIVCLLADVSDHQEAHEGGDSDCNAQERPTGEEECLPEDHLRSLGIMGTIEV